KVVLEVPAPSDGVIKEIKVSDGTTVTSGQVLAVLEPGAAGVRSDGGGDAAAERQAPAEQVAVRAAERARAAGVAADTAVREAARSPAERETAAAAVERQRPSHAMRCSGWGRRCASSSRSTISTRRPFAAPDAKGG